MQLSGTDASAAVRAHLRSEIERLEKTPTLAFVLVGEDQASQTYVRMKKKGCAEVGINSHDLTLDASISEETLLTHLYTLNHDPAIDGVLVQQPLPPHIDTQRVVAQIDPAKDVDGFHPLNLGKLLLGLDDGFVPCTPLGIQTLLTHYNIPTAGKHIVIVGRSNIVGKPLATLLMQKKEHANATVTVAHSRTQNLPALTRTADIVVAAIGSPHFLTADHIADGAVVIDVGINRVEGKIVGDVDFDAVAPKCAAITPVPGGVGPMTVAMLLHNTVRACR